MKYLKLLVIVLVLTITSHVCKVGAESRMSEIEFDSDRYGLDYASFDLKTSDPTLCEEMCASDPKCQAWTYIKPNTVQGPKPRCWLKYGTPMSRQSCDCVSGIKILESRIQMVPQSSTKGENVQGVSKESTGRAGGFGR